MKLLYLFIFLVLSCGVNQKKPKEIVNMQPAKIEAFDEFVQKCNAEIVKNSYFRIAKQTERINLADTTIKIDTLIFHPRYSYSKWKIDINNEVFFLDIYFWKDVDEFLIQNIESEYFIEKKFDKSKRVFKVGNFYCVAALDKTYSDYMNYLTNVEVFLLRRYIEICNNCSMSG